MSWVVVVCVDFGGGIKILMASIPTLHTQELLHVDVKGFKLYEIFFIMLGSRDGCGCLSVLYCFAAVEVY